MFTIWSWEGNGCFDQWQNSNQPIAQVNKKFDDQTSSKASASSAARDHRILVVSARFHERANNITPSVELVLMDRHKKCLYSCTELVHVPAGRPHIPCEAVIHMPLSTVVRPTYCSHAQDRLER